MPRSKKLFKLAAEQNYNLGYMTAHLLKLLDQYGSTFLKKAVAEAIEKNMPNVTSIQVILERLRELRQQPPPIAITLSADKRVQELVIKPHDLATYDQLSNLGDKEDV